MVQSLVIKDPAGSKEFHQFPYDSEFSADDSQQTLFDRAVKPIVDCCLEGYNGCIFAYGQTASGKTYTMQGSPEDPGVIPNVAKRIVAGIAKMPPTDNDGSEIEYQVFGSYLEIYQEHLNDLLVDDAEQTELKIGLDPHSATSTGYHVEGLTQRLLATESDCLKLIEKGTARRRVAETSRAFSPYAHHRSIFQDKERSRNRSRVARGASCT